MNKMLLECYIKFNFKAKKKIFNESEKRCEYLSWMVK